MNKARIDPRLMPGIERAFKDREPELHALLNRWELAHKRRDGTEPTPEHVCAGPKTVCRGCGRPLKKATP